MLIEQGTYNKILENMPIPCVDVIVKHNSRILFLKRNNEPEKDKWWLPGGRILKGEKSSTSAKRKVKEETGLNVRVIKMVGITETVFDKGPGGIPSHTINLTYLAELINYDKIELNKDHSQYSWLEKAPEDCHEEIKRITNI